MSLVSNEGDSEQNEIRNLQEKLESTMSLVKQLSGQLAELKEQVSELGGREGGRETPGKKPPQLCCVAVSQQAGTPPSSLQVFLTLWKPGESSLLSVIDLISYQALESQASCKGRYIS